MDTEAVILDSAPDEDEMISDIARFLRQRGGYIRPSYAEGWRSRKQLMKEMRIGYDKLIDVLNANIEHLEVTEFAGSKYYRLKEHND